MSKAVAESKDLREFLQKLSGTADRVLILDYDGTVAPFATDRDRAYPYPEVRKLLNEITSHCRTRLIMISERSAHEVSPLLGLEAIPEVWGTHGAERLLPDGRYEGAEVSDEALQVFSEAETRLLDENLGHLLDVRPAAVSVHWRGLKASEILTVRKKAYSILEPFVFTPGLLLAEFDGGIEIRLRSASKGDAVRTIIAEISDDVPVAYLGDDAADEDAFRALNGRGLTVLVRRKLHFTAAQIWLRPPDEVVRFLIDWIKACEIGA